MSTATLLRVPIEPDTAKKLSRAAALIAKNTIERDHLIVMASMEGASLREIAVLAGMTHVGVKKVLERVRSDFIIEHPDGTLELVDLKKAGQVILSHPRPKEVEEDE